MTYADERLSLRAMALREEGMQQGQAGMLLNLVRLKFGEPDARLEARVSGATETDLTRWSARILTAESVEELFR